MSKASDFSHRVYWAVTLTIVLAIIVFVLLYLSVWPQVTTPDAILRDVFMVVGTVATLSGFVFSVWITLVSLRSEATLRESLNLTRRSTSSQTHLFHDFGEHLKWLEDYLSCDNFSAGKVHVRFALSTFSYGIGVLARELEDKIELESTSAARFCKFVDSWLDFFERRENLDDCMVDVLLWSREERHSVFDVAIGGRRSQDGIAVHGDEGKYTSAIESMRNRFEALANKLVKLNIEGKIRLNITYSNRSDTRLFLACDEQSFRGLMVVFSPLNESSIRNCGWRVCGLSVNDEQGYRQLSHFFARLSRRNHDPGELPDNLMDRVRRSEDLVQEIIAIQARCDVPSSSSAGQKSGGGAVGSEGIHSRVQNLKSGEESRAAGASGKQERGRRG